MITKIHKKRIPVVCFTLLCVKLTSLSFLIRNSLIIINSTADTSCLYHVLSISWVCPIWTLLILVPNYASITIAMLLLCVSVSLLMSQGNYFLSFLLWSKRFSVFLQVTFPSNPLMFWRSFFHFNLLELIHFSYLILDASLPLLALNVVSLIRYKF